jgi:hypothetical protein
LAFADCGLDKVDLIMAANEVVWAEVGGIAEWISAKFHLSLDPDKL